MGFCNLALRPKDPEALNSDTKSGPKKMTLAMRPRKSVRAIAAIQKNNETAKDGGDGSKVEHDEG